MLFARTYNPVTGSFTDGNAKPWFHYYSSGPNILFGHQKHEKIHVMPNVYALDGHCVFGGQLRAVLIDGQSLTPLTVKATKQYAENIEEKSKIVGKLEPFENLVQEGFLRKVETDKLVLYGYTDKCTFDRHWNEFTRMARGIVFEKETGKMVAKPFPKFYNLGEQEETMMKNLPKTKYQTFEKIDGSLGIVFYYDGRWNVCTRGSFNSDQAIRATEILKKYDVNSLPTNMTFLVEIVYPENKIIVDYGDQEILIGLGAFFTDSQEEVDFASAKTLLTAAGFPFVKEYFFTIEQMIELQKTLDQQSEGFVVRFDNGLRVKIKGEEYMRISKLISHMSPIALWEAMGSGIVKRDYLEQLPEELRKSFEPIVEWLETRYREVYKEIEEDLKLLPGMADEPMNKKLVGLLLKNPDCNIRHKSAMFPCITGKKRDIEKYIMKTIRPTANILR